VSAPFVYLTTEFTIEFTLLEFTLVAEPAPLAVTCFCAVQCITACDEQSAEHSAAVLAAHATWELTDALTPQATCDCTVHVA
jgi:hypothetical protein